MQRIVCIYVQIHFDAFAFLLQNSLLTRKTKTYSVLKSTDM